MRLLRVGESERQPSVSVNVFLRTPPKVLHAPPPSFESYLDSPLMVLCTAVVRMDTRDDRPQRILTASRGIGRITERDGWDRPESDDNTLRDLGRAADPPDEVAAARGRLAAARRTQTCIRVGPNIAVPTDAKSSGASLPSTLVPGVWASGITLSAHHAPRTSLGGGKVVVSHVPTSNVPAHWHRTCIVPKG